MKDSMVGARLARLEDPALLKGKGKYVGGHHPARHAGSIIRSQPPPTRDDPLDRRACRA